MTTLETDGGRARALDRDNSRATQLWWCFEGILGASITGAIIVVSYSVLADLTAALGLLSSTALAFLVILAWVSVWSIIAAARTRVQKTPEATHR